MRALELGGCAQKTNVQHWQSVPFFCVETPFVYVKDQKYFRGNDDDTHAQYEK